MIILENISFIYMMGICYNYIKKSQKKPNVQNAHPLAESQQTNQSAHGNKRRMYAANAKIHILLATMTKGRWRCRKRKGKYTLPFLSDAIVGEKL